jgi:hypothetical protein
MRRREEAVERKENRSRVFFSFYTRAGQVPAPKKIVYPKSSPIYTGWKKSNPYLQKKKT